MANPSDDDLPPDDGITFDSDDYDVGEECGRWDNGKLRAVYWCSQAGTEFCDFDCPYRE